MAVISSQSQTTLQNIVDNVVTHGDIKQVLYAGGFNNNLVCTAATDVMEAICAVTFPWKWNMFQLPLFYTSSWQQDYALVWGPNDPAVLQGLYDAGDSVTNLAWLCDGVAIQINNSSTPKPWSWVEVGRRQGRSTAALLSNSFFAFPQFAASFEPNNELYYGTWGAAQTGNSRWGNNPQPNQELFSPIAGGASSQPGNPVLQIQDANGNYLVCTTFGTTGSTAPSAPANSAPGTPVEDGSVVWTVVDPYGQGIRLKPIPSQTGPVWQFGLAAQMKPVRFSPKVALSAQTLFPLTDDYENVFRAGFIAQCYMNSPEEKLIKKGEAQWARWTQSVQSLSLQASKQKADRERDEDRFVPGSTILSAGSPRVGWYGAGYPYGPVIG
jgi:hypothetical protein